jgi:hypothetical protein
MVRAYKYTGDMEGLSIGKMRVLMCIEGEEKAVRELAKKFDAIFCPCVYEESNKPGEITIYYTPFVKYEAEFIKAAK